MFIFLIICRENLLNQGLHQDPENCDSKWLPRCPSSGHTFKAEQWNSLCIFISSLLLCRIFFIHLPLHEYNFLYFHHPHHVSNVLSFESLILSGFSRQIDVFLQDCRTHWFAGMFCSLRSVCVYFSLYWLCSLFNILAPHDSDIIDSHTHKSVDHLACSLYGTMVKISSLQFHQLIVIGWMSR